MDMSIFMHLPNMILQTAGVSQFKLLILLILSLMGTYVYYQYMHPNIKEGETFNNSILKLPVLFLGLYLLLLLLLFVM
jgi:predicted MFS family arabinose efflux permease